MKTLSTFPKTIQQIGSSITTGFFIATILFSGYVSAQKTNTITIPSKSIVKSATTNFTVKPFSPSFVVNKGQFDQYDENYKAVNFISPSYGCQMGNAIVLFNGTSIQFVENLIHNKEDKFEVRKKLIEEREFKTLRQTLTFINANANAEFISENKEEQYFTYPDSKVTNGTIVAEAWKNLTVKNIYPGIDLSLSFKEEGGIKYSFIVSPGVDPSIIKMKWNGVENISIDGNGNLKMNSENGIITDQAPSSSTYLGDVTMSEIDTKFILSGKIISFQLANYDHSQTLVIDPWVFSPNLSGNNRGYDIQHDPSGNIYCYGGSNPYQLQKYTSLGAPIWSYNTSASGYYGDFTLDAAGNAYCIYGPWGDAAIKLSPGGTLVWSAPSGNGSREIYRIFPNPVNGQMSVMGMEIVTGLSPMVLNIDPATGTRSPSSLHPTCTTGETRCMSVDANGDVFGLVYYTGGSQNHAADNFIWKVDATNATIGTMVDGYNLGESDPSNTDSQFSGFNGTAIGCDLFTYDGMTVKKWDKTTLALLASVAIPGGIQYTTGGLCTDNCGNVYVGGPNSILEFDNNLNPVTTVATTGQVYDVNNGNVNGEIIACGNGFFGSYSFPVSNCSNQLSIAATSTSATCSACNGTATATPSPAGTYTYSWSPSGQTTQTATNLCPGIYTVTVMGGCINATQTVIVTSSSGLSATSTQVDLTCFGTPTGSATVTPTGGQGPYTYSWAPSGGTGATATGLSAGTYTCTITDANGCTYFQTTTITQPPGMNVAMVTVNETCFGQTNGSSTATVSGGNPGYTYAWSPTGGNTAAATNLSVGNYTFTVTDANGCIQTQSVTITEPPALINSMTIIDVGCNPTGQATANTSGGTGPYTYLWQDNSTSSVDMNLTVGSYTVLITDANGCTLIDTATINAVNAVTATQSFSNVTCFGASNGTGTVVASGGTSPYTYSWSPIGGNNATATGLPGGTYTVTITDANGCIGLATITIIEPPALTSVSSSSNVTCNGGTDGSGSITTTGGTNPFTYSWSPSGGNTASVNGLAAGTYTATATDSSGCVTTQTITITQPTLLLANIVGDSACAGTPTQISVSGTGGTAPYTYSWSNGPTTQVNNININTTTSFTATITDAYGCIATGITTVTINPNPVASITSDAVNGVYVLTASGQLCFYGPSNGVTAWAWTLQPGTSNLQSPCVTVTAADTGSYCASLIVQNSHGCLDTASICVDISNVSYSIPNVFTPNGDGTNEAFIISNSGMSKLHCVIYDRWGVLVYEWDTTSGSWDGRTTSGKEAVDGVYYWIVDMEDYAGTQYNDHGFVHLIRGPK